MTRIDEALEALQVKALATDDGRTIAEMGFNIWLNAGGCTAWKLDVGEDHFILITGSDGCNHDLIVDEKGQPDDDHYIVGLHLHDDPGARENSHICFCTAQVAGAVKCLTAAALGYEQQQAMP